MPLSQTSFLVAQGGRLVDGKIVDFGNFAGECDAFTQASCLADASDLGLLRIHGADAPAFLHSQLSTNVLNLSPGQGQVSTYNSPKGRMLASLFLWRATETETEASTPSFYALVAADLAASLKKRLSMFVLRAKVSIDDCSADHALLGLCGTTAATVAGNCLGNTAPLTPHRAISQHTLTAVALSAQRIVLLMPLATLPEHWPTLCQQAQPAGLHLWRRAAVLDGTPLITTATADQLIPQAANADALGALDFQKGCYPGQEIVARTRYLGRTKERLYIARSGTSLADPVPTPGASLYSPVFGTQACGIVINAAPDPKGPLLLVSIQTAAAASPLHLQQPDGPTLTLLPLPYELPVVGTPARPKL